MKKFDRLPPEKRREEIKNAALKLFAEKGFSATTMEDIVGAVSLSKGGVYRIYPSSEAILSDLMLDGMHMRNEFYASRVKERTGEGKPLNLRFLIDMLCDSLLLYPEISTVYVEFLIEKRRNEELQRLYERICAESIKATEELIASCGTDEMFLSGRVSMELLTELMNTAILGIDVLKLRESFSACRELISEIITAAVGLFAEKNIVKEIK